MIWMKYVCEDNNSGRFVHKLYTHKDFILLKGVNSRAQDSLAQDSMTNDLFLFTRDFSRIFLPIV